MQIPIEEVKFHPSSLVDRNGQLFEWQNRLYRAIGPRNASFVQSLFASHGVIEQLLHKELLVETELEPLTLEGYGLILKHRRIPFVSYAYEWTPSMLKDAAIHLLRLNLELAAYGLTTQDAHPWNVLFDSCKPVFVDIGSIVPANLSKPWPSSDEFSRFFLHPLLLFSQGENKITRWLLHDHRGISLEDMARIERPLTPPTFLEAISITGDATKRAFLHRIRKRKALYRAVKAVRNSVIFRRRPPNKTQISLVDQLEELKEDIENIEMPKQSTLWLDYYSRTSFPSFENPTEWTLKHKSVVETLVESQPHTVLDIASNRGWYSRKAAKLGSDVVSFDTDEPSINMLYADLKQQRDHVLPLIMDILSPSPGYGWFGRGWAIPATNRFQCEMVLALAIIHHIAFKASIPGNLCHIVDLLGAFAQRWLLIEFVPPEDQYVAEWYNENYSWYSLDNLVVALERDFRVIRHMPSYPAPRILLLCERK